MEVDHTRAPRKDQLRNRQRLVTAAREAFTELGPDVNLEEIARRAGVGPTTLYRHFATKDDLVEAVLDDLITSVRANAEQVSDIDDPRAAFRAAFTTSCDLSERDIATFAHLAAVSPRADAHAQALIATAVGPPTARLREAGGLRPGITIEDIARFIRMTVSTGDADSQGKAIEVLLAGLIVPTV
jgi:AcrR family transcriptional regulator